MKTLAKTAREFWQKFWREFAADCQGAIAIIMAFLLIPIIAFVGLAVDSARLFAVQTQLEQALDAAALAGGRLFYLPAATRDAKITDYFNQNLSTTRYGATLSAPLSIVADTDAGTLTVSATATVPMTLIRVLGFNTLPVGMTTQVTRKDTTLELALTLDVTGSMMAPACLGCPGTKIHDLKVAAKDLVNILFDAPSDASNIFISVVPFTDVVKVGAQYANWTVPDNPATPWPSEHSLAEINWAVASDTGVWEGCTFNRDYPNDIKDTPPGAGAYFWPYAHIRPGPGVQGAGNNFPFTAPFFVDSCIHDLAPVKPLTNSKQDIINTINALDAVDGATQTTTGTAWGWRTISPNWRGEWNGVDGTRPYDYGHADNFKAIVLMTDGLNNFNTWNAYLEPRYKKLGVDNYWAAIPVVNARQEEVCTLMKAQGIRIYTIAFGLGAGPSVQKTTLSNCAIGSGGQFFDANSGLALSNAFQAIASDLAALRLSQ